MLNLKKQWVKVFAILLIIVVLPPGGLAVTAYVADSYRYTHDTSSLVGIWIGEKGNVFELSADTNDKAFDPPPKIASETEQGG